MHEYISDIDLCIYKYFCMYIPASTDTLIILNVSINPTSNQIGWSRVSTKPSHKVVISQEGPRSTCMMVQPGCLVGFRAAGDFRGLF